MGVRAADLSSAHERERANCGRAGGTDDAAHRCRGRAGKRDRDAGHLLPKPHSDTLCLAHVRRAGVVGWHVPDAISRTEVRRIESRDDDVVAWRHAENPELPAVVCGAAAYRDQPPGAVDVPAAGE